MRSSTRVCSTILVLGLITLPLRSQPQAGQSPGWQERFIALYDNSENGGTENFLSSLENEMQQKFDISDKHFLTKTLSDGFKHHSLPKLSAANNSVDIMFGDNKKIHLALETGEKTIWKVNGKILSVSEHDSVQNISQKIWDLLNPEMKWGPYPNAEATASTLQNIMNWLLPPAHAQWLTVAAVAIVVIAVVAAIVYFVNKAMPTAATAIHDSRTINSLSLNFLRG